MAVAGAREVRAHFLPGQREVVVRPGQSLLAAAREAGLPLSSVCGGQGTCGKCRVLVEGPLAEPLPIETVHLDQAELERGVRLACQTPARPGQTIHILRREAVRTRILGRAQGRKVVLNPEVRKVYIPLGTPSNQEGVTDWERLRPHLPFQEVELELAPLRQLPRALRASQEGVTLALHGHSILAVEPGDTTDRLYGVAFDIGTSTVVAYLMDLTSGREIASASALNSQGAYGEDLISRLAFTQEHPQGLEVLRQEIVALLNRLIAEAAARAGVGKEHIYEATVVGNVVMHHLFLGIDPQGLAAAPYAPVLREGLLLRAGDLGLELAPQARVHLLPNIAGFVGADMVGVLLTVLPQQSPDLQLIIDLGTNGEIALGSRERLLVCSTAAGPAFEGARIQHGMRAASGAIDKVHIGSDMTCRVIDGGPALGICGSGLIDAVAGLLEQGIIDKSGRFLRGPELPSTVGPKLRARLKGSPEEGDRPRFVLVPQEVSGTGAEICLTQQDIRELQLAKGAIYAGVEVLKRELGIEDRDISQVLLAGAFGTYISAANAQRIGLIPAVPKERVRAIGNAAGFGAQIALLSSPERRIAELAAHQAEHVRLSGRPDFQDEFLRALHFPSG